MLHKLFKTFCIKKSFEKKACLALKNDKFPMQGYDIENLIWKPWDIPSRVSRVISNSPSLNPTISPSEVHLLTDHLLISLHHSHPLSEKENWRHYLNKNCECTSFKGLKYYPRFTIKSSVSRYASHHSLYPFIP